jgi:periplasmic copper chaperone A
MPMKRLVPLLAVLICVQACDRRPEAPSATVENAVVTLPAVPARPGAAYFTLRTNHDRTRLTGVSSPQVGRIELHQTVRQGGVSRMGPLRDTIFSPDAPLTLEPGGRHAMLFEMDPSLRPGGRLRLTFTFERAPQVSVEAEVRAPGDAGRHGE